MSTSSWIFITEGRIRAVLYDARTRRFFGRGLRRGFLTRRCRGDARNQRHPHPAGGRHGKLLRGQVFAIDGRRRLHHGARREATELRAALRIGFCGGRDPTISVTSCPATLFPIRSRTTRTLTVAFGSSGGDGLARDRRSGLASPPVRHCARAQE